MPEAGGQPPVLGIVQRRRLIMMIALYDTKKAAKEAVGQELKFRETSMFGPEYKADGVLTVAHRPHITGRGREWFGRITMKGGLIAKVE
jgi:hypothetical protein